MTTRFMTLTSIGQIGTSPIGQTRRFLAAAVLLCVALGGTSRADPGNRPPFPPGTGLDPAVRRLANDLLELEKADIAGRQETLDWIARTAGSLHGQGESSAGGAVERDAFLKWLAELPGTADPRSWPLSSIALGQPGSCVGLVCAAVLVGRTAGLPAHAAAVPDHLLLLLDKDGGTFYELLDGAKQYTALDARLHYRIPDGCRAFLRPLTDAELLACVRIERAAEHIEAGRLRPAARDLRIATRDFPDHPAGHYNLGLLQARREQWLASETSFSKAIACFALDARYWHNRALARWRLGRVDQAGSDLDEALRLNPEMSEALRLRAVLQQIQR